MVLPSRFIYFKMQRILVAPDSKAVPKRKYYKFKYDPVTGKCRLNKREPRRIEPII